MSRITPILNNIINSNRIAHHDKHFNIYSIFTQQNYVLIFYVHTLRHANTPRRKKNHTSLPKVPFGRVYYLGTIGRKHTFNTI